jgi:hypothetical protein
MKAHWLNVKPFSQLNVKSKLALLNGLSSVLSLWDAMKEHLDWLMETSNKKDVLKFASMACGGQYVTVDGEQLIHM